jgi:hypothetical protein
MQQPKESFILKMGSKEKVGKLEKKFLDRVT